MVACSPADFLTANLSLPTRLLQCVRLLKSESVAGGNPGAGTIDQHPESGRWPKPVRLSIYVLVLALSFALVAPAIGFLVYIVGQQNRELQRQIRDQGVQLASEISDRLEQELESLGTMLAVFASSGWLEADELERLHHRASLALAGTGRHLIVLDDTLDQLLNTRVHFGEPLGKTANTEIAEEALKEGELRTSNVFFGRVAEAPVFNVLRPAALPDGRKRILILTRNAATLGDLLGSASLQEGWSFVVLDGEDQLVTGRGASEREDAPIPPACSGAASSLEDTLSATGEPYVFRQTVDGSPWRVCVWTAADEPSATDENTWTALLTAAATWIAIAIAAAVLLSAIVSREIAGTARMAAMLGSRIKAPLSPSIIAEVDDVRRSLAEAAAERVRNDQRLELLLREAAHRAKNQIALAGSLLHLSSRSAGNAAELRADLSERLLALSRSVDALTGKAPDTAHLDDLVRAQLVPFVDDRGERLSVEGEKVLISERAAQSLGLVLHELATNATKYGAWKQAAGKVTVRWHQTAENLVLDWSECGAPSRTPEECGFGTTLMKTLIESGLGGQLERTFATSGFACRIILPRDQLAPQRA